MKFANEVEIVRDGKDVRTGEAFEIRLVGKDRTFSYIENGGSVKIINVEFTKKITLEPGHNNKCTVFFDDLQIPFLDSTEARKFLDQLVRG